MKMFKSMKKSFFENYWTPVFKENYDYTFICIRVLEDRSFCCQIWILFYKGQVQRLTRRAKRILPLQSEVSSVHLTIFLKEGVSLLLWCPAFASTLILCKGCKYLLFINCEKHCISAISVKLSCYLFGY